MSDISERSIVHCPESEASHRLAAFFTARRIGDGSLNIGLGLPIEMLAALKLPIERRGVASVSSLQSAGDPYSTYSVCWSSKQGWPFPDFMGALAVERVPLPSCFGLVLSGYYQPTLAAVGARFDPEAEWRIGHRLTRELLRSIAEYIENTYFPPAPQPSLVQEALSVAL